MSRLEHIEQLIVIKRRRLESLELREAHSGLNTPPEILTEIADLRIEIEILQEERAKTKLNSREGLDSREGGLLDYTTPVGRYSPKGDSPYGAADMAGNVLEWCSTIYDETTYPFPVQDEWGKDYLNRTLVGRVMRGGSVEDFHHDARCACRTNLFPEFGADPHFGFRVVVSPI